MVARTRPDPVTPVSLEGKNASASEVPETRDTSTSTRSNMAMVFVGVVLGLSFLAFVLCTTTRYLRRRRMQKLVYNRNTDGKAVLRGSGQSFAEWKALHMQKEPNDEDGIQMRTSPEAYWERDICAICLESIQDSESIYTLQCRHMFHFACAEGWYARDVTKTCPVCRRG